MAKFDLTSRIGQYLDRHLAFPLLEFLDTKRVSHFLCHPCGFLGYTYHFFM